MNTRSIRFFGRALLLSLAAILLSASNAFAQRDALPWAFMGGFLIVILLIAVAFYVYSALALQTIAQKTNTENGWLAWIPIANLFLMVMIAKKPAWWILLCFIPFANLVILILLWMAIAEARGKPNWWGIMLLVPVVNIVVPGYLAWSD